MCKHHYTHTQTPSSQTTYRGRQPRGRKVPGMHQPADAKDSHPPHDEARPRHQGQPSQGHDHGQASGLWHAACHALVQGVGAGVPLHVQCLGVGAKHVLAQHHAREQAEQRDCGNSVRGDRFDVYGDAVCTTTVQQYAQEMTCSTQLPCTRRAPPSVMRETWRMPWFWAMQALAVPGSVVGSARAMYNNRQLHR